MPEISPKMIIETIMQVLDASYGSLGYTAFKLHAIEPNASEDTYMVKYSFIPRSSENKRIYYLAKINVKNKNLFQVKEIKEEDIFKDDS